MLNELSVALSLSLGGVPAVELKAPATPPAEYMELGFPLEVAILGQTVGIRPELIVGTGDRGNHHRVRVAAGFSGGVHQLFIPLSLGYRAQFRDGEVVQPFVGLGVELQLRVVRALRVAEAFGPYLEGGVAFALSRHWRVGVAVTLDAMVLGASTLGVTPRALLSYRI